MRKKFYLTAVAVLLITAGLIFAYARQYYEISFLRLKYEDIKEIKLHGVYMDNSSGETATESEARTILGYLNSIKHCDERITDHSWPAPKSEIEIFTKDGKCIQIRGYDEGRILIGYTIIAKQKEISDLLVNLANK